MTVDALEAYKQVIDPWSGEVVASWGWFRKEKDSPGQYWVKIGEQAPQFFTEKTKAQQYFYANTHRLRAKINHRRLNQERGIPRRSKAAAIGR